MTGTTLEFEPLIAPALWVALAVVSAVVLTMYAWRRPGRLPRVRWSFIIVLMTVGLGLVLATLLNPMWVEVIPPPAGKPLLTVLVDASRSMATPDEGDERTRYEAARRAASDLFEAVRDEFEVRTFSFAEQIAPAASTGPGTAQPDGALTDLAGALASAIDEDRPQGQATVLLSDGIHNADGGTALVMEAVRLARAMASPVYVRTFGGAGDVRDVSVALHASQELAFVEQKIAIAARVEARGVGPAPRVVILSHDGVEIERKTAAPAADGSATVRFSVARDERGLHRYEVRVDPVAGEVSEANNQATFLLRVVDEPIRILLVEGSPYWDSKFLMRTLAADMAVELDAVVRMAEGRLLKRSLRRADAAAASGSNGSEEAGAAAVPDRVDRWEILADPSEILGDATRLRSYTIVVIGRDAEAFLTDDALTNLRRWLARDGGSLVCYRGSPAARVGERLARILPVRWAQARETRFRVRLTERGRSLRWLSGDDGSATSDVLSRLPSLVTRVRPEGPKPTAVVLATAGLAEDGRDVPVVSYQPYGTGRVVFIEGAGMWRWAFLPPQHREHDTVYGSLWHSLLRWLVSSADLLPGRRYALRPDKTTFSNTDRAAATLLVREGTDESIVPTIELSGSGLEEPRRVTPVVIGDEPGTFRVQFGRLPPGRYTARIVDGADDAPVESAFDVRESYREQLDVKARPDLMNRIAQDSGGAVLGEDPAGEIVKRFAAHQAAARPPRVRRVSAWDRWWALVAVLLVWTTAWGVRRSGGLI